MKTGETILAQRGDSLAIQSRVFRQARVTSRKYASSGAKATSGGLLLSVVLVWIVSGFATGLARADSFPVYCALPAGSCATLHDSYGLSRIQMVYEKELWTNQVVTSDPDESAVRAKARLLSPQYYVVLDIEQWPLSESDTVTTQDVEANIQKYIQVLKWIRNENPNLRLGYYGMFPIRSYWAPVNYLTSLENVGDPWWDANRPGFKATYDAWRAANARLAAIAQYVDAVFPSLYTFYDYYSAGAAAGWVKYAQANIEEAKSYGKPVFPFIWMRYHDSNATLKYQYLPAEFWRLQLDTIEPLAKGVVVWDSYALEQTAPWLQVTTDFMAWRETVQPPASRRFRLAESTQVLLGSEIRTSPSLFEPWPLSVDAGTKGAVFGGPVAAEGSIWWLLKFMNGTNSWIAESRLSARPAGLVGHWTFSEGSGAKTVDGSTNENHGSLAGAVSWDATFQGRALQFDGSSTAVTAAGKDFDFGTGDFTIATWAKMSGTANQAFIAKGVVGTCCAPDGYPGVFLGQRYGKIVLRVEDNAVGLNTVEIGVASSAYQGQWTHFAGVRSNNVLYLYVNGILATQSSLLGDNYNINNNDPLALGAQVYFSKSNFLLGTLDDARVYNRALTVPEIVALAQPGATPADTIAPSNPGALSATAISTTDIHLAWQAALDDVNVAGYQIVLNGVPLARTALLSYVAKGLDPGATYTFTVWAYDQAGNPSVESNASSATTWATPDALAPTTPAGLTALAVSSGQVDLSWSPSYDNQAVMGYQVFRDNVLFKFVTGTVCTDLGLDASTAYSYSLIALDWSGNKSVPSAPVTVQTKAIPDIAPPLISGINAIDISKNSATIVWATDEPADSRVNYGKKSTTLTDSAANTAAVTSHSVRLSGLNPRTTYYFVVTSRDVAGNASSSSIGSFRTR